MRLRRLAAERGTAVVEFALVAPILFLLVFGIIDFARALNYYNDLTQLAGQGARAAAVYQNPSGGAVTASSIQCDLIRNFTSDGELKNGITVNLTPPAQVGSPVKVTTSYTFRIDVPLVATAIGAVTLPLSTSSAHRAEVYPSTGYAPAGSYTNATCP